MLPPLRLPAEPPAEDRAQPIGSPPRQAAPRPPVLVLVRQLGEACVDGVRACVDGVRAHGHEHARPLLVFVVLFAYAFFDPRLDGIALMTRVDQAAVAMLVS